MVMIPDQSETNVTQKSIAVFYPSFAGGGAESVALWILEALKTKYDITLFTTANLNLNSLNSMYGTQLSEQRVKIRYMWPESIAPTLKLLRANNDEFRMLFAHLFIKYFKENTSEYDLVLSAYNAVDMGRTGIQYLHWIKVFDADRKLYKKISKFSEKQLKSNWSMSNSYYVADRVKKEYGIDSTVVYPPVVLDLQQIPWEEKENAFICSGRLTQPKQPHKAIQILSQVREKGFDVKLYLTGGGGGIYGWQYMRFLKKRVAENQDWVELHENLPYKDYVNIVRRCRYGIHCKREPFGISIAEMVKAGAIPFVKTQGGQVEIVGQENVDLLFQKDNDAIEKIIEVLSHPEKQEKLRTDLENRKKLFSTQKFMEDVQAFVERYFESN